jgi:carbon storage regulator
MLIGELTTNGCKRYPSERKEFEMLVLSRKVGERIHVGDNIVLEIRRIAGNRVTLALEAPRDVRILRGELNHAAREFRTSESNGHTVGPSTSSKLPPGSRFTVLNGLPAQAASRDFAI